MKIPHCGDVSAEAVAILREHHQRWFFGRSAALKDQEVLDYRAISRLDH
jgi:hypothetical protein